mmetsp:Transcript_3022/g.2504  ORF Transcript_3022/g.2504 Transcript_3022/m.2504 type:complete len:85 (+) Transcript_3022:225-479(+)
MLPENYYKLSESRVAVCTPQLSDMMELKQVAFKESMVYFVDSSGETSLGIHITEAEKKEYYSQVKSKKNRKRRRRNKSAKKEDL